jgi:hypothetical protein
MSNGDAVLLSFQNLIPLDTSFQDSSISVKEVFLCLLALKVTVLSISRDLTI